MDFLMKLSRFSRTAFCALPLTFVVSATAAPPPVLRSQVPAAARLHPVGRLPQSQRLDFAIGLPLRHREALTNLLQQLYDPASPAYHQFLTPEQFAQAFGPTEQDYQALIAFARTNGLTVTGTHPNRVLLDLNGSVADIERAFHVTMRLFQHPTENRVFHAPDVDPTLNVAVPVLGVSGLDNYILPRPMNLKAVPFDATASATPRAGSAPGGNYIGNDFRAAYVPAVSLNGAGQSLGLFELDGYFANDITQYESQAGLTNVPVPLLQNVLIDGFSGSAGSANTEVALDIEAAIALAPGLSNVIVYEGVSQGSGPDDVLSRMASDKQAKQLSCSWGFGIDAMTEQIFQQFIAQGQSFFVASGDGGAYSGPVVPPSDDPFATSVGGTTLTTSGGGSWMSETTWSGSGGGVSQTYAIPGWQQSVNMSANQGSTTMRNLPDVAMVATNIWLIANNGGMFTSWGTSAAAPLWAAFTALVNQQAAANGQPPVGFINPAIYAIGQSAGYSADFHDITTGNNTNSGSLNAFFAVAGYDLCTGWGSPNGSNMINALAIPDVLRISPRTGFTASGPVGGPFSVTSLNFSLTNAGATSLNWKLANTPSWLNALALSGTLAAGGSTTVTLSLNSAAGNLLIGDYVANVLFMNSSDGVGQSRQFNLAVGNPGFETGDFSDWTFSGDPSQNFVVSVDDGTIGGVSTAQWVHTGIYGATLGQAGSLGSLSQTLPTVTGQPYLLSLWFDNPLSGTPNEFVVTWNGNTLSDQVNLGVLGWTNLQFIAAATGPSTALNFEFQNDSANFGLDDVSVTPVTAPVFQSVAKTGGAITFTWSALVGQTYQLQYKTNLTQTGWSDLSGTITATNSVMTGSDPIGPDAHRFYRVILLLP